ncbi:MAG: amino acid ABC transporter permease [Paeniglutamicibacter terrestris]
MSASVLFDTPGPKAKQRILLINIIGTLLIVGLLYLVISGLAAKGQMDGSLWASLFTSNAWVNFLLPGLLNTLKAAGLGIVLSVAFGLIFGMGLLAEVKALRWFSTVVVEFFRAVPVLLMIVFFNILLSRTGVVDGTDAPYWAVVISLMLYNGSVVAELVRSGVRNLPKGQREAGIAIGLTGTQSLRLIEIPQALVAMLPALIGQFVVILKDSALGYIIGFTEFLFYARTFASANGNMLQALLVAAAVFILINFALSKLAEFVSRRLSSRMPNEKPAAPEADALLPLAVPPGDGTK